MCLAETSVTTNRSRPHISVKMAVGELVQYAIAVCLGVFWCTWVLIATVIRYLKNPWQKWSYTVRIERPPCLQSCDRWTHHLVALQHEVSHQTQSDSSLVILYNLFLCLKSSGDSNFKYVFLFSMNPFDVYFMSFWLCKLTTR